MQALNQRSARVAGARRVTTAQRKSVSRRQQRSSVTVRAEQAAGTGMNLVFVSAEVSPW